MKKIKVFIIDDSAIVREILSQKLSLYREIEIVGSALNPFVARNKLEKIEVDVITLDIEMPKMDGLTFLKYLMKYRPTPVIVVSSLTDKYNKASIEALELGAVDIVPKPGGPLSIEEVIEILKEKIIVASKVDLRKLSDYSEMLHDQKKIIEPKKYLTKLETTNKLIAVGTSTGGTQALEILFKSFDVDFPPTLAVIHMPERFTASFAKRLDDLCKINIKEAENNEKIMQGTAYIAPGNYHMILKTVGTEKIIKIISAPKIYNQRPAVEPLFNSVAQNVGKNCIGVLLTGMGRDGAGGLLNIKKAGGSTIVQDEKSSIVWGMPKEAIDIGAADFICDLEDVSNKIKSLL